MRPSRLLIFATILCASLSLCAQRRPNAQQRQRERQGAMKVNPEEQHKAHVARVFDELFTQGRYEFIKDIYQPRCPVHTNGRNFTLQEAVSEGKGWRTAAPDLVMTANKMSVSGDIVTVSWTARGTHTGHGNGLKPTGRRLLVHGESRFKMANGKIAEVWNNYDQKDMFRQLGVSPTQGWLYERYIDVKLAWNHAFSQDQVPDQTNAQVNVSARQ